ncbi:MAG TPA: hypothetical protein VGK46_10455 [Saprospiraceae bacterium]
MKLILRLVMAFLLLTSIANTMWLNAQGSSGLEEEKFGSYTPNAGFRLATTDKGVLNFRIYTYIRYLNQLGLDSTYTDSFGETVAIDRRQDVQINKVNIQFNGWLMDPRFRYLLYVWTNNTAQGQSAQVVVAGNLHYHFNKHVILGGGINALPGVRSTEGNFPFWLTVDNRPIADEFFRPSYTSGFWVRGLITDHLSYNLMLGNNLSQLGIDAGQLDPGFNTFSGALNWFPTTGEYGLNNNFGDFENHQEIATRVGAHFSRSDEDKQGVPTSEAFENVTIRLSDGSPIFKANLFGPGIQINNATYEMASFDAGVKYKGFSLEGEFYLRRIKNMTGPGIETLDIDELHDNGFQLQASAMVVEQTLQVYSTYSVVNGEYGDPSDLRFGLNWFPWKNHVIRWNAEYINTSYVPVGGLSLPYPVGGNGSIVYTSFQVNF